MSHTIPVHNPKTVFWLLGPQIRKEMATVTEETLAYAKRNKTGVYFVVNMLGEKRNKNDNLRDNTNITALVACFVDLDDGDKQAQMERLRSSPIPFSTIVESGRGYHGYFLFEEPELMTHERAWRDSQHALATFFHGDKSCNDPSRLMRLPGSWHFREGMEPSLVKIVETSGYVYSLREIMEAFHVSEAQDPRPREIFYLKTNIPELRPTVLAVNERHPTLKRQVASYLSGTPSAQYATRVSRLKAWYIASCIELKPFWEQEVEDLCGWVALNEWGHVPPL